MKMALGVFIYENRKKKKFFKINTVTQSIDKV